MPRPGRLLVAALALVTGAATGLLGSFVHRYTAYGVPSGLLAALALSLSVVATLGLATRRRGPPRVAAAGWLVVVLYLASRRPEGDLIIAGDGLGYAWLFAGTVVAGLGSAFPYGLLASNRPK